MSSMFSAEPWKLFEVGEKRDGEVIDSVISTTRFNPLLQLAREACENIMSYKQVLSYSSLARVYLPSGENLVHFQTAGVGITTGITTSGGPPDSILDCTSVRKDYQTPKYPIVLCHGFSGFDRLIYIPALGFSTRLSPFSTKAERKKKKSDVLYSNMVEKDEQELDPDTNDEGPNKRRKRTNFSPDNDPSSLSTEYPTYEDEEGIELFEYWHGVKKALEAHGCQVLVAKVPPFASIETRAQVLDTFIQDKATKWQKRHQSQEKVKINLVAHSMGGLDCRYLISKLEHQNYEVMSLTTISTPHRGTYAADFVVENAPQKLMDEYFPSIRQLTRKYSDKLNRELLDDPSVKYFSFGASAKPSLASLYYIPWHLIEKEEGPNDGMVSLRSCRWGKYMGHLEGVNHKQLINWRGGIKRMKEAMGINDGGFNPLAFYLGIADNLATNGL
ncbi:DEKNAAC105099 [Brettanomyces naardenensis]|uniref:DEKNAAC105099 n=1 Tax=Brettanomyces naardenensis TaxID=13370 RepID=A0A448YT23_BRENA|nr:DEKNAAC105099 [Brettanomyces naardenensis]